MAHYQLFVIGDNFAVTDFRIGLERYRDFGRNIEMRSKHDTIRPANLGVRLHTWASVSYPANSIPALPKITYDMLVAKRKLISMEFARRRDSGAICPHKMAVILKCMRDPSQLTIAETTYLMYDSAYPIGPAPYAPRAIAGPPTVSSGLSA